MKIIQRHFFKGSQEFEIIDDYVRIRSKAPFRNVEELTVMLTVLNPEPVITRSSLCFTSRVNGEALVTLELGKPDAEAFNAFVALLKRRALEEYQAFAGLRPGRQAAGLAANVYEEPPDFDADSEGEGKPARFRRNLDAERIDEAIRMLETYLNVEDIRPLVTAMEALRADPASEVFQSQVVDAFNELGPRQGAVLTYAPYVGVLLSDGPAGAPY